MIRKMIFILISVIAAAALLQLTAGSELSAEALYPKLESYKESLEITVAELRDELADKKNELAGLDRELSELETQYNILLTESRRITKRLEYLKGVQK